MMNKQTRRITICVVLTFLLAIPVFADDITESISEALESYNNGDFTEAVSTLNYAAQLIQQKKGGNLESLLPEPLTGWTAEEASSQAMGAGMFGAVTVERDYTKGQASVSVTFVTDSPMIQGMAMMFSNSAFAVSDGGKLEKIAGQKAIVKYDAADKWGEIQIMVANRFLVMIEGDGVAKSDLQEYAEVIDYKKLAAMP
jgi:hypothetical protein